jgi:carotenoid cleavage dioxygenase-like enzyme
MEQEGELPPELRGTLYRNGPGLLRTGGAPYAHWFDGDGAVAAVHFDGRRARGAIRLVRSAGLRREQAAGRMLYGGYGGKSPHPIREYLFERLKNPANTSVALWRGRLFALCEVGPPTELRPDDLSTLGETRLDGVVLGAFSAHPHYVPARKTLYNFGVRYKRRAWLDLYALGAEARRLASIPLAGPSFIHDFIATEKHLVFFAPPLRLRLLHLLLGRGSFADNLAWKPELGSEVIVVPIDAPDRPVRITVPAFFQFHFGNAFERGSEIVVDAVTYSDFQVNRWLGELTRGVPSWEVKGRFERFVIDPARATMRSEIRHARSCEFPRVAPADQARPYRFAYVAEHSERPGAKRGLQDRVAKLDVERGEAQICDFGESTFPSEPVFVPRPGARGEDEGWLLTLVYDAERDASCVAVLDAKHPEVIARAWFDHAIPFGFHGGFAAS